MRKSFMPKIDFVKTHALGNDFILIPAKAVPVPQYSDLSRRICDRHFGIGADGAIFWDSGREAVDLRIFNQDGGEAELSGNGIRCAAAYLMESGRWAGLSIPLRTVSGTYTLRRNGAEYEADMGLPSLRPEQIPFQVSHPMERVIDYPFKVAGQEVRISLCATGNPHCSLFVTELDETLIARLGPALERHPAFPNRTNVEFIQVIDPRRVRVAFWERGVGRSHASGTGSCGAVVACVLNARRHGRHRHRDAPGRVARKRQSEADFNRYGCCGRTIQRIVKEGFLDLVIVGAGPTGLATAIEAQRRNLSYAVLDKGCVTNSIFGFPSQMVFFTTPELLEIGGMPLVCEREKPNRVEALKYYRKVVEALQLKVRQYEEVLRIEPLGEHRFRVTTSRGEIQTRNVVLATGYYDNPNLLGIPGEDLPHVSHYYTEPYSFWGRNVVVVGGRNSAAEAALDLFRGGAKVTLVHRGAEMGSTLKYWVRPDIENRFKAGQVTACFNTSVTRITKDAVEVVQGASARSLPADQVFLLTGYHAGTKFLDQLGVNYDAATLRPQHDTQTFETNVPGVYLAGSVTGGRFNAEIFIENGRFHGERVVAAIAGPGRSGDRPLLPQFPQH
jgi:thioredoxin reductase (NADPH)